MTEHIPEQQLALYAGRDLPEPDLRSIEQHLPTCEHCRQSLMTFEEALAWLTPAIGEPEFRDLERVRAAVVQHLTQGSRHAPGSWAWTLAGAVAATTVVLVWMFAPVYKQLTIPAPPKPPAFHSRSIVQSTPAETHPIRVVRAHHRSVRPGIREVSIIASADSPTFLKMSTTDPNVVILWQSDGGSESR